MKNSQIVEQDASNPSLSQRLEQAFNGCLGGPLGKFEMLAAEARDRATRYWSRRGNEYGEPDTADAELHRLWTAMRDAQMKLEAHREGLDATFGRLEVALIELGQTESRIRDDSRYLEAFDHLRWLRGVIESRNNPAESMRDVPEMHHEWHERVINAKSIVGTFLAQARVLEQITPCPERRHGIKGESETMNSAIEDDPLWAALQRVIEAADGNDRPFICVKLGHPDIAPLREKINGLAMQHGLTDQPVFTLDSREGWRRWLIVDVPGAAVPVQCCVWTEGEAVSGCPSVEFCESKRRELASHIRLLQDARTAQLANATVSCEDVPEPKSTPLMESKPRKQRAPRERFYPSIVAHLAKKPHDTAAEVAAAVGCSTGVVGESPAWKANQQRLKDAAKVVRDPAALPLVEYLAKSGASLTTQLHAHREEQAATDAAIDERERELFRQIAAYEEAHPDHGAQQVAKAVGCTAGDIERRQAMVARLTAEQERSRREDYDADDPSKPQSRVVKQV